MLTIPVSVHWGEVSFGDPCLPDSPHMANLTVGLSLVLFVFRMYLYIVIYVPRIRQLHPHSAFAWSEHPLYRVEIA